MAIDLYFCTWDARYRGQACSSDASRAITNNISLFIECELYVNLALWRRKNLLQAITFLFMDRFQNKLSIDSARRPEQDRFVPLPLPAINDAGPSR